MHTKQNLLDKWNLEGMLFSSSLVKAFKEIKREDFIPKDLQDEAYSDNPLSIGNGQTISQPTTVMLMLDALELKKTDRVLEIGAGSGYNAALMSKLADHVYSVEIVPELAEMAKDNIKNAKIKNVEIILADGSLGHKYTAPYDKIIITAACPKIPDPLVQQLKEGGIILAPVGDLYSQIMVKAIKKKGELITKSLGHFTFVPLKGKYGHK